MKTLKETIYESLMINEDLNPRGSFKVVKPFPTNFMWEYYLYMENPEKSDDPDLMEEMCEECNFAEFLKYAEKKKWEKVEAKGPYKPGYYIIPTGVKLKFDGYMSSADHVGMWKIDRSDVYLTMTYDELSYGDYDEYLKPI